MPDPDAERWRELYDRAFPQVYRALVAATLDRERALDGLHDAFEEGLRHPPADDRHLEGWLYRVALRKTRRGIFRSFRETRMSEMPAEVAAMPLTSMGWRLEAKISAMAPANGAKRI